MTLALRSTMQFTIVSAMAVALALCCMFSFAPRAHAASLSQDKIQGIAQLLAAQGVDQQHIDKVVAVLMDASVGSSSASSTMGMNAHPKNCPTPTRSLGRGSRGDDVAQLQQKLMDDGFLGQGNATGFFGSTTEQALKHWQSENNVVASGTPETTGFGRVGPMTMRAIERSCAGSARPDKFENASSTGSTTPSFPGRGHENRGGDNRPPMPPVPPTATTSTSTQSNAGNVGQFVADYSDSFNQNLAAVASAPFDFYVPILADLFTSLGLN